MFSNTKLSNKKKISIIDVEETECEQFESFSASNDITLVTGFRTRSA
jgi:hypothetical protein